MIKIFVYLKADRHAFRQRTFTGGNYLLFNQWYLYCSGTIAGLPYKSISFLFNST